MSVSGSYEQDKKITLRDEKSACRFCVPLLSHTTSVIYGGLVKFTL